MQYSMNSLFLVTIDCREIDFTAQMLSGKKKWEFRANENFGKAEGLTIGDVMFFIDINDTFEIKAAAVITAVLRGSEMLCFFNDKSSGHWRDAACEENTNRDWDFFLNTILTQYHCAIGLEPFPIDPVIPITEIRYKYKEGSLNPQGMIKIVSLNRRFEIQGMQVEDYFRNILK